MFSRTLIPLLLCASAALPAPQNGNITYVKQLDLEPSQPELKSQRESRIEKIPLTIPGNNDKEPTENTNKNEQSTRTNNQPNYNYSDRIYSIKTKPKINTSTDTNISKEEVEETESPEIKNSDILPAESVVNDRIATNDDTGLNPEADATQSDELVTEKYEEETTLTTVAEEETTKAPTPRQLAKLSYFGKSTAGSFSQNLIAHPEKRRYRTRCKCEKIWNCAKLQISVPRCPEEEFMCCS